MVPRPPAPESIRYPGPWTHRAVSANGIQLHVAECGDGPLVVLLHGFPEFWYAWRHQLVGLAERGYRAALGIIRLAGRYGAERAEAACARALRLRSYSCRSVESILRTGLDRQPLPGDTPALPPHPARVNVRGPDYCN